MRVPGVDVDDVGANRIGQHAEVARERLEHRSQTGIERRDIVPGGVAAHAPAVGVLGAAAEAAHVEIDERSQVAGELVDVDPGPAVDLGRELVRQDERAHALRLPARRDAPPDRAAARRPRRTRSISPSANGLLTTGAHAPISAWRFGGAAVQTSTGTSRRRRSRRSSRARSPPRPSGRSSSRITRSGTRSATARSKSASCVKPRSAHPACDGHVAEQLERRGIVLHREQDGLRGMAVAGRPTRAVTRRVLSVLRTLNDPRCLCAVLQCACPPAIGTLRNR